MDEDSSSKKKFVLPQKVGWINNEYIRPYLFMRRENFQQMGKPGTLHDLDWFGEEPLVKDPLRMDEVDFANRILTLEQQAFDASGMAMDRWVFYDCAVMPGLVTGFAAHTKVLPAIVKERLKVSPEAEWIPLSLFIIIPTMTPGEWVAHNLCSANSLLEKKDRYWGLGFMSKAFGLWYANIRTCIGMTQWKSPALKLHSHYGNFKVLTAYTPVHTYSKTITYRLDVDTRLWPGFFGHSVSHTFKTQFDPSGFKVEPDEIESLKKFQTQIEEGKKEFYLDAEEILDKPLDAPLIVYSPK